VYVGLLKIDFLGSEIFELLKKNSKESSSSTSGFHDLDSGEKVKKMVELKVLGKLNQISVNFGYDGVKRGKNNSPWPIFFCINELPLCWRFKSENLFIAAIAFSKKHNANQIFAPLIHQLKELEKNPPMMKLGEVELPLQMSVVALVCDLQGKCKAMLQQQYNAYCGCYHCYQISHRINKTHVYPFETEELYLRSGEHLASILSHTEKPFVGVKGYTVLWNIPFFDVYSDVCLEYMHQQFINSSQKVFEMILNFGYKEGEETRTYKFNIKQKSEKIFQYLWMPSSMERINLGLEEYNKFKAIHWKYFVLYWSIPLLYEDDPPQILADYWRNYVKINVLLCAKRISAVVLQQLHKTCVEFVKSHTSLFGSLNATVNIHNLLHVRKDVERLGLMIGHSAFPFESESGVFVRSIDGTQEYPRKALIEYCKNLELRKNPTGTTEPPTKKDFIEPRLGFTSHSAAKGVSAAQLQRLKTFLGWQADNTAVAFCYSYVKDKDGIHMETLTNKDKKLTDDTGVQWRDHQGSVCHGQIVNIFTVHPKDPTKTQLVFEVQKYTNLRHRMLHFTIYSVEGNQKETELALPDGLMQNIVQTTPNNVFFCQDVGDLCWA
jgi:hypothetical protein